DLPVCRRDRRRAWRRHRVLLSGPGGLPARGETLRALPARSPPQLLAERRALHARRREPGLRDEPGELPGRLPVTDRRVGPVLAPGRCPPDGDRLPLSPGNRCRRGHRVQAHGMARADWFDRTVFYTQDEPDFRAGGWDRAIQWANLAHAADPGFRVLLTAPIATYASHAGAASGVANIIAPVVDLLDNRAGTTHYGNQRPNYDAF